MDRLHVANFSGTDHLIDAQVTIGGPRRSNTDRLISEFQIGGVAVGLAVDCYRFHAHLAAGTDHSQRYFTAIGYQNPFKHRLPPRVLKSTGSGHSRLPSRLWIDLDQRLAKFNRSAIFH
jgi:hypothetical protein